VEEGKYGEGPSLCDPWLRMCKVVENTRVHVGMLKKEKRKGERERRENIGLHDDELRIGG
jgi:hypothetical protein